MRPEKDFIFLQSTHVILKPGLHTPLIYQQGAKGMAHVLGLMSENKTQQPASK